MATTSLKNYIASNIGTTATTVYNPTASGIQSTVIGLSIANITTSTITVSVTLTSGATTVYIIKDTTIPSGNALSILKDSKIIVEVDDNIKVQSSLASSCDVTLSVVEIVQ
jgi:hypothetical protein